ncbi:TonB family protein [Runella sp.]|uniref:TonB family protein n=1 Tax=Runella sp. TaxID=1960881 RepID=UPI003016BB35
MELFIYLGKAGAGMIALYVVYWLWLRKHTYFAFNRFYLLTALLISLGAPFVVLPEKAPEALPMAEFTMEPTTVVFQPEAAPLISTEEILLLVYALGALVLLVRLGVRLWQIRKTIRSGERLRSGKYILVRASNENVSSFSFLNYLVVSQKDADSYGEVVLRHELAHIRQRHSWDLLWIEFVHVFMWFNPILIFFKRSLKEIHEFIADEQATNGDRFTYARTLAGYAFGVSPQVLTNNFFDVSQLKNRIAMLTKNRSSRWVLGRYLLALPVVIGLVVLVAARSAEPEAHILEQPADEPTEKSSVLANAESTTLILEQTAEEITVNGRVFTSDGKGLPGVAIVIANTNSGTITDLDGNYLIKVARGKQLVFSFVGYKTQVIDATQNEQNVIMIPEPKELGEIVIVAYGNEPAKREAVEEITNPIKKGEIFTVVEQNPEFPGGMSELGRYLGRNIRYPAPARRANVEGKVFVLFVVSKDGDIRSPKITKGIGFGCDEEALRVVLGMPRWIPGKQNGKEVNVEYSLPIKFVLEKQSFVSSNGDKSPEFPGGTPALNQYFATNLKYPTAAARAHVEGIVLVGFTVTKEGAIKDIVIDKGIGFGCDAEAIKLVSKMPNWNPAVKDSQPVDAKFALPVSFVLEKKTEIKTETFGIERMNDTKVDMKVGDKKENAILNGGIKIHDSKGLFTTKPLFILDGKEITNEQFEKAIAPEDIDNISVLKNESATAIHGEKGKYGVVYITSKKAAAAKKEAAQKPTATDALWLLDGKEMAKEQIQKLSPDSIQSMNVLKGEEATKKYGEKGKNGVIEITTKKN